MELLEKTNAPDGAVTRGAVLADDVNIIEEVSDVCVRRSVSQVLGENTVKSRPKQVPLQSRRDHKRVLSIFSPVVGSSRQLIRVEVHIRACLHDRMLILKRVRALLEQATIVQNIVESDLPYARKICQE